MWEPKARKGEMGPSRGGPSVEICWRGREYLCGLGNKECAANNQVAVRESGKGKEGKGSRGEKAEVKGEDVLEKIAV